MLCNDRADGFLGDDDLAGRLAARRTTGDRAAMPYDVTLIRGDGVGPELAEATRMCIDATGVAIQWDEQDAGVDVMEKLGTPIPDSVLESCRRTKVALKAPITTPVGTGFRSVNVYLRQALDLFACVRPCKLYTGVRTLYSNIPVDIVIVRENTEDLYFGCEFEQGKPETAELIADIKRLNGKVVRPCLRAYSNAYLTIRRVPKIEMALIVIPESGRTVLPLSRLISAISSAVSGFPCSNSQPK